MIVRILRWILENNYVSETSNPQEEVFGSRANAHIGKCICSIDEVKSSDMVTVQCSRDSVTR